MKPGPPRDRISDVPRHITDFGRPTFIARRASWSWDGRSVLSAVAEGDADIFRLDGLLPASRE
jgi:hypothetical protein